MDDKWDRIRAADSDSLLADFLALRARAEKAEAALDQILGISAVGNTMGMSAIANIARKALVGKE